MTPSAAVTESVVNCDDIFMACIAASSSSVHHSWSCRINLLLGIVNCSYKNVIVFCFDSSFLFIIEIPLADKVKIILVHHQRLGEV